MDLTIKLNTTNERKKKVRKSVASKEHSRLDEVLIDNGNIQSDETHRNIR